MVLTGAGHLVCIEFTLKFSDLCMDGVWVFWMIDVLLYGCI
jgi:hypothetical protein